MQKKKNILVLIVMLLAILAMSTGRADAACSAEELANYECAAYGEFEVRIIKPFPSVAPCIDDGTKTCSTYTYELTKPGNLSDTSFGLIIERPFADLIVGGGLNCSGEGNRVFGTYLTWNCNYMFNVPDDNTFSLVVRGMTSSAPSDWILKYGLSYAPYAWGIIQAPAISSCAKPAFVIAKTMEEFTYVNVGGDRYTVKVNKDMAGNITSIVRTLYRDGEDPLIEDITDSGIPIETFLMCYDPPVSVPEEECESLKFITDQVVTKTGQDSNCAYWYNNRYYNFCGYY